MSRRPPSLLRTGITCVLLALALAAPASAETGLALRWPLDQVIPGDPPTTPDLSGNGLRGTSETPFTQVPGRFGSGLDVTGARRVTGPPPASTNFAALEPQALTVALWVKRAGYPGPLQYLVTKGATDCSTAGSYAIYTGYAPGNLGLQFYAWNSTKGVSSSPNAGTAIYDGNWHAVAGTFDGTTARLYVDGVEVPGAAPGAGGPISYDLPGSRKFVVGGYADDFTCPYRFSGSLDEVRVYGRALSAAEIGRLHDPAATSPPEVDVTPGGGGAGGGGPGGGGAGPLKVSVTAPAGALKAGTPVALTASAGGGAAIDRYLWDLDGNGSTDAECNGAAPVLEQRFTRAYAGAVSVTAVDTSGVSATGATNVAVARGTAPAGLSALARQVGGGKLISAAQTANIPVGLCRPPPGQQPGDVTPAGGPPAGCVSELVAGLVSAIGCLKETGQADLPKAERDVLNPYFVKAASLALNRSVTIGRGKAARASAVSKALQVSQSVFPSLFGTTYVSTQTVRINGVDYQPAKGASIVVVVGGAIANPASYVLSSDAIVSINGVTLRRGPLKLQVDLAQKQVRVTDFVLTRDVPFTAGLDMAQGRTSLDIVRRGSLLATHLELPGIFGGVTGDATIRLSNPAGAKLDALRIDVGQFKLAGVGVDRADLVYSDNPLRLAGSAKVQVAPDGAGPTLEAALVLAAPPGKRTLQFQSFAGAYTGPPFIPLAPGVDLFGINGSFALFPPATELGAGATVTVGAPVPCAPYKVDGQALLHFHPSPVTFDFKGTGSLFCLPIAEEYLHVEDTGYVAFGGKFDFDAKVFSLSGRLDAQFRYPHFQAEGAERGCIAGYFCAGGRGIVSDRGAAFCLSVDLLVDTVEVGAGFDWPPPATLANPVATAIAIASRASVFTGCGFGKWRTVAAARAAGGSAAQAGERAFAVPAGLPAFSLAVVGTGGVAPDVELRGPKGESFVLPESGRLLARGVTGFRSPVDGTAYFAVARPSAGTWRVVPRAGSSAVTSLRRAAGLADPSVTVTRVASGAGGGLAYRYRVRPIAGQRVTFVERAPGGERTLAVARGGSGVLRFRPSDARGTKRSIVAIVEQDGLPRANLVVARFTAAQARPGRVAGVRVVRAGRGAVRVQWGRAVGASRYEATVKLSDGRSLLFTPRRGGRVVTVRGVRAGTRVRVRIVGVRGATRRGPAVVGALGAPRR